MTTEIVEGYSRIEDFRDLVEEIEDIRGMEGIDTSFQHCEEEIAGLPGGYSRPYGGLFLALVDGEIAGCVAYKRIGETACEMKRLYVRERYRKVGLGRRLAEKAIEDAGETGYSWMYLDTVERYHAAVHLYESMGAERVEPYYENPLEDAVFFRFGLGTLEEKTLAHTIDDLEAGGPGQI